MAQELLAVKLGEMDQKIGKLHGRIESSEYADAKMLQDEIENLRRECREQFPIEWEDRRQIRLSAAKAQLAGFWNGLSDK